MHISCVLHYIHAQIQIPPGGGGGLRDSLVSEVGGSKAFFRDFFKVILIALWGRGQNL